MATTVISTLTDTGTALNGNGDRYILLEGVTHHFGGIVLRVSAENVEITVLGTLLSTASAPVSASTSGNLVLTIGQTGHLISPEGFLVANVAGDTFSLLNNGEVIGAQVAATGNDFNLVNTGTMIGSNALTSNVEFLNLGGDDARVVNSGLIHSGSSHVINLHQSGGYIENSGTISGVKHGINAASPNADVSVRNSGHIGALEFAISGNNLVDTVVNMGTIVGDIELLGGNDLFDGRGGSVSGTVSGGLGNDTFIVDNDDTVLMEALGEGTDTVRSRGDFTLGDNFEILTLRGSQDINGVGNSLGNTLNGNGGDNRLAGAGGVDTISGRAGNDTLRGGRGNDALFGQDGRDRLDGGANNDVLDGGNGGDVLLGRSGNDLLIGGNGNDRLEGGLGRDQMSGSKGEDVFVFSRAAQSVANRPDSISDFDTGEDRIDLSGLDLASVNIGSGFTGGGVASARTVETGGGNTNLMVDVNGDGSMDMKIVLLGTTGVAVDDLIL